MEILNNGIYDGQECVAIIRNANAASAIQALFDKAASYDRIMAKVAEISDDKVSSHFDITYITHHDLRIGGDDNGNGGYILHTKCLAPTSDNRSKRDRDIPFMAKAANLLVELKAEQGRIRS